MYRRAAFTLVELSIVLVILGLLVGGVLAGQSLIHAAELRAISSEYTGYKTALNAFKEKYFSMPGDMPNAVRFWGPAAGGTTDGIDGTCQALDHTSPAVGTETCNGDGNGQIDQYYEAYRVWQQLANAGMIEGKYTGVFNAAVQDTIGSNIPKSRFPSVGWRMFYLQSVFSASERFNNGFCLGGADFCQSHGIKPEDAYNIDTKLDDGKPITGSIGTPLGGSTQVPDCVVPVGDDPEQPYVLSEQSGACYLMFKNGY